MANKKITELPPAGTITGAEVVPLVQGGVTTQATVSQLLALVIAGASSNLDTFFEVATRFGLDEATVATLQTLVAGKADTASVAATYVAFRGSWVSGIVYPKNSLVIQTGAVYLSVAPVPARTTFNVSDWLVLGGVPAGGGATPVSVTDNGDGTYSATGITVTDNGDGTYSSTGSVTDNGDGTFALAA